jgi:hypothetical protein
MALSNKTLTPAGTFMGAGGNSFDSAQYAEDLYDVAVTSEAGVTALQDLLLAAFVPQDAAAGIYLPETLSQFRILAAYAGLTGMEPSNGYLLQEASGDAADSFGAETLPDTTLEGYQQAVTDWTRTAVTTGPQGDPSYFFDSGGTWPNKATTSTLTLLLYARTAAVTGTRDLMAIGATTVAALLNVQITADGFLKLTVGAGDSATGAVDYGADVVVPIIVQHDVTNEVTRLITDQEVLAPDFSVLETGAGIALGGVDSSPGAYLYALMFEGESAELTLTQIRTFLQTMGFTVTWSP